MPTDKAAEKIIRAIEKNKLSLSGSVAMDITVDAGQTVVSVYDLAGRLVDVIMDENLATGEHRLFWDTIQGRGGRAPTGVYLINVRHAAGLSESRKIVILNQ